MQSISVLFVCLGNICRSPAAEGIFKAMVDAEGLSSQVFVDSAGTAAYHAGERADQRMIKHAAKKGYDLQSIARKFDPHADFDKFDYIIAMDGENFNNLRAMDVNRRYHNKIHLMTDFCETLEASGVPDPYYGGDEGFQLVLSILEDACNGLIKMIKNDLVRITK